MWLFCSNKTIQNQRPYPLMFPVRFGAICQGSEVCIRSLNTVTSCYRASIVTKNHPLESKGWRGIIMLTKWSRIWWETCIQMCPNPCDWFCGVIFFINVSDLSACNDVMLFCLTENIGSLFIFKWSTHAKIIKATLYYWENIFYWFKTSLVFVQEEKWWVILKPFSLCSLKVMYSICKQRMSG